MPTGPSEARGERYIPREQDLPQYDHPPPEKPKDIDTEGLGSIVEYDEEGNATGWTGKFDEAAAAAQEREAPQMTAATIGQTATLDETKADEFRAQQTQLAQLLAQRAMGQGGPSIAEMQMQRALQSIRSGQQSAAAGASGQNRALAQRTAANASAMAGQDVAGQTAMLRAQEQQAAQQQWAGLSQQARAQDLAVAQQNAQFEQQGILTSAQFAQQAEAANLGAKLTQQQLNDQYSEYLQTLGFARDAAEEAAALAFYQAETSYELGKGSLAIGQGTLTMQQAGAAMGGIATLIALLSLFSDKNMKEDIKPAKKDIGKFLDALKAHKYKYKKGKSINILSENKGEEHAGIMAQDLLKSKIGKNIVMRDHEGSLMVKIPEATSAMLASLAEINDRLKKVEKK